MRQRDVVATKGGAGGAAQVLLRLDPGELGALQKAVEDGRHLRGLPRPGPVMIPATEHHATQGAFGWRPGGAVGRRGTR